MQKVPISRELDKAIDRQIGEFVNKATCQLFLDSDKFEYSPLGTGILAKIGNKYYLLTAAHVAEEFDKKMYLMTPKGDFLEIFGDCQYTNHDEEPKIDVAFIIIEEKFAEKLAEEFKFISEDNIKISHNLMDAANYSVFGYPAKNVRLKTKEGYISTRASFYVLQPSVDKLYDYYKFDRNLFYILEFKGRGIDLRTGEKSQKLGQQNGMSGGGLWFMSVTNNGDGQYDIEFSLIGIMTDEPPGRFQCLVGNKINVLLSGIADYDGNEVAAALVSKEKKELYIHHRKNES